MLKGRAEPLISGLLCFWASLFGRQSLGLSLTYRSWRDQALAILGAASLSQSVGEQAALLSAVSNAGLLGGCHVCPCPRAVRECRARLEQANPGFSVAFHPRGL